MDDYLKNREALLESATPGVAAARQLSALTDEAVRDLARAASSRFSGRWAIVAVGGWGCGALLPSSDVDILVLSDARAGKLKPFVEAVLYPLWDAGLTVGHQVRSPKEHLRATRDDLVTCTASLTARTLAGDVEWAQRALDTCATAARKRARSVLAELALRPRPGSPYLLEPDLKEGAGGRRDYDELTWTAAIMSGHVRLDPSALVDLGLLTADEMGTVTRHAETISTARWLLARSGGGSVMSLEDLGALPHDLADAVQLALAETALMLARVRRRARAESSHDQTALSAAELFSLLDDGDTALTALEDAAQTGRLEALLPGYRELMTLRRPGLGHELTVGAHSLKAATLLRRLAHEDALASSARTIPDLRTLRVATLAHDVGKTLAGSDHPERGAEPAADIALRFGLDSEAVRDVSDLVRLHLVLAESATRIDLDDEDAILLVAARIQRRGLLAPLHLLTAADSLATGPATWSPWTATLVGTLVSRLNAALSDDVDGAGLATRGESVRAAVLAAVPTEADAQRRFVRDAPLRYLASRRPEDVIRDSRLVAELMLSGSGHEARVAVSTGPVDGTHTLTIVTSDRPELLARISGALALAGLDILAVDAYGAPGHVALDTFVVASATRRPVTTDTFTGFERLLRAALKDRLELKVRLAERRRHYPPRSQAPPSVSTVSEGFDTAVRVRAPDRPGLLHDLAQAVSATGLNIRWAKAVTVDGMAIDTFHVVDADGGPVHDDGVIGHLAMRMREIR